MVNNDFPITNMLWRGLLFQSQQGKFWFPEQTVCLDCWWPRTPEGAEAAGLFEEFAILRELNKLRIKVVNTPTGHLPKVSFPSPAPKCFLCLVSFVFLFFKFAQFLSIPVKNSKLAQFMSHAAARARGAQARARGYH